MKEWGFSLNKTLDEDGSTQFDLGDLTQDINDNDGYYIFGGTGTVGETTEMLDGSIRVDSYGNLVKFTSSETLTDLIPASLICLIVRAVIFLPVSTKSLILLVIL